MPGDRRSPRLAGNAPQYGGLRDQLLMTAAAPVLMADQLPHGALVNAVVTQPFSGVPAHLDDENDERRAADRAADEAFNDTLVHGCTEEEFIDYKKQVITDMRADVQNIHNCTTMLASYNMRIPAHRYTENIRHRFQATEFENKLKVNRIEYGVSIFRQSPFGCAEELEQYRLESRFLVTTSTEDWAAIKAYCEDDGYLDDEPADGDKDEPREDSPFDEAKFFKTNRTNKGRLNRGPASSMQRERACVRDTPVEDAPRTAPQKRKSKEKLEAPDPVASDKTFRKRKRRQMRPLIVHVQTPTSFQSLYGTTRRAATTCTDPRFTAVTTAHEVTQLD